MNKIKGKILYLIGGIIFALSSSMLSIQLIINEHYEMLNIIVTATISFLVAMYFGVKTLKTTMKETKKNIVFSVICGVMALIVLAKLYETKGVESKELFQDNLWNPFRIRNFMVSCIAMLYLGIYIGDKIKKWLITFYQSLDAWDKKAYLIASGISCVVIVIAYCFNQNWFLQYDKIYSLDSGWCFEEIYPKATYYDIRHPILSVITFPIWAVVHTMVRIVFPGNLATLATAIFLQLINAQLLILIGLQIKQLIKNKMVFILYMLSFSTILYGMFFEKYQLCIFLIVLYVTSICRKKEGSIWALIASFRNYANKLLDRGYRINKKRKNKRKSNKSTKNSYSNNNYLYCFRKRSFIKNRNS